MEHDFKKKACILIHEVLLQLHHHALSSLSLSLSLFFTFFYKSRRKYWFAQILEFQFLIDLYVLGYPEYDFNTFGKSLPVCEFVCLCVCVPKILWQV